MKIIKQISFLLALSCYHTASLAAPYLALQVGVSGYQGNSQEMNNIFDVDSEFGRQLTGRLALGYLWALVGAPVEVGMEAAVQYYEPYDRQGYWPYQNYNVRGQRTSLDALAVLDLHPIRQIDLFLKGGPTWTFTSTKVGYWDYDQKEVLPKAIAGIGYNATAHINLNLSVAQEFSNGNSASSALLGFTYRF